MNSRLDYVTYPPNNPVDFGCDWVRNRKNPPSGEDAMVFNDVDELTTRRGDYERTYSYYDDGTLPEVCQLNQRTGGDH
jgi:hypothetical protein